MFRIDHKRGKAATALHEFTIVKQRVAGGNHHGGLISGNRLILRSSRMVKHRRQVFLPTFSIRIWIVNRLQKIRVESIR